MPRIVGFRIRAEHVRVGLGDKMYRAPLIAVAALALAIVTPSGPSHGADLSCSENEVRSRAANVSAYAIALF